jgi:DNA helicase HerA-like ATPase
MDQAFRDAISAGYGFDEPTLIIGSAMLEGELFNDVRIQVPMSTLNRHGLVAGATGTGKTKTLQLLAGQLSEAGVPVFVADIKGDLTGLAAPGDGANPKVQERAASLGWTFEAAGHPVDFLSLTGSLGSQVRATVHSFGPLLLGKVLDLNETQTSILALVFKYCDDNDLPLLDLKDLATTLKFLSSDEGKPILEDYGGMSSASVGVLLRSIVVLEQEGADVFFGEPEFDVEDLLRSTPDGKGVISVLELSDVMDQPRLFSTFMLWMLAQLYETLPEAGDLPKPKLCFFFDEAHLLFDDASDALLEQVERTARLIRSKGVGVYFVTQAPTDVPASVLSQLGNRVQHALRAFTPDDADALRKTARTFPKASSASSATASSTRCAPSRRATRKR